MRYLRKRATQHWLTVLLAISALLFVATSCNESVPSECDDCGATVRSQISLSPNEDSELSGHLGKHLDDLVAELVADVDFQRLSSDLMDMAFRMRLRLSTLASKEWAGDRNFLEESRIRLEQGQTLTSEELTRLRRITGFSSTVEHEVQERIASLREKHPALTQLGRDEIHEVLAVAMKRLGYGIMKGTIGKITDCNDCWTGYQICYTDAEMLYALAVMGCFLIPPPGDFICLAAASAAYMSRISMCNQMYNQCRVANNCDGGGGGSTTSVRLDVYYK